MPVSRDIDARADALNDLLGALLGIPVVLSPPPDHAMPLALERLMRFEAVHARFGVQDEFLGPGRYIVSAGRIGFMVENQGVWTMWVPREGHDPAVEIMSSDTGVTVGDCLSETLWCYALQEVALGAPFRERHPGIVDFVQRAGPSLLWEGRWLFPPHELARTIHRWEACLLVGGFVSTYDPATMTQLRALAGPVDVLVLGVAGWCSMEARPDGAAVLQDRRSGRRVERPPGTVDTARLMQAARARIVAGASIREHPYAQFRRGSGDLSEDCVRHAIGGDDWLRGVFRAALEGEDWSTVLDADWPRPLTSAGIPPWILAKMRAEAPPPDVDGQH